MCIIFYMLDFIGSNLFANIIATIELAVAIGTILIGGKKVSELIADYRSKQMEAAFGLYSNLGVFIKRIRILIFASDGTPLKTLYLLSPDSHLNKSGYKEMGKKLCAVAHECLQFLSSTANQIPPGDTNEEREDWKNTLDTFVEYLNEFYLIDSEVHFPKLCDEAGISSYYGDIKNILSNIETRVEKESIAIFERIKNEKGKHPEITS